MMAEGNERHEVKADGPVEFIKPQKWPAEDHDFVQVNGEGIPPLYVRAGAIDAIGIYGERAVILILDSGKELIAKGTTPAEVVGLLALPEAE